MYKLVLLVQSCFITILLSAQTPVTIIAELKSANNAVANIPCDSGRGAVITNRAMNLFLADKVGTYLSQDADLSLFKNYSILDAAAGRLSVNHNMYKVNGIDERAASFLTIGARANVANAFAAIFTNKKFTNELGFTLKQTWIGKGMTYFDKCLQTNESAPKMNQKQFMDAQRAAILHTLEKEITTKAAGFENTLNAIDSSEVPGQNVMDIKAALRQKFNTDLQEDYSKKFASLQADALAATGSYRLITGNWTSIAVYIPLITQRFTVAKSFSDNFEDKHIYPLELNLSHNRLWEFAKAGRFFLNLNGGIFLNNSAKADALQETTLSDYKSLGGTDTIHLAQLNSEDVYIGNYSKFITPFIKAQVTYIPLDWHIGISLSLEQNFGTYQPLNGKLGFPIVLIDKEGKSALNFEFQLRYFDMNNKAEPGKKFADKTSVGLSIGVPFSSVIY